MNLLIKKVEFIVKKILSIGVDDNLTYVEKRQVKLINLIIVSLGLILLFFVFLNIYQERYSLLIGDIASILLVCIPALILHYKKKYLATKILVVSSFFIFICFFSIVDYEAGRKAENLLLGACIMPIFLLDGWKKNFLFFMFVLTFFLIKSINTIQHNEVLRIETYYLIYFFTFLTVYVIASYFKYDLLKFNKQLQESNKAKDKLFSIIAHDIKNPFSSLLGLSNLQLKYIERGDQEKLEKTSLIINEASERIYNLAESLLEWSITQSDKLIVNKENCKIYDLVNDTLELCKFIAKEKNIKLNLNCSNQSIEIDCDKIITQIVLRNIILNAIKYSHQESEINININDNEDKFVVVEVSDYGVGMSQEKVDNIYNKSIVISSTTSGTNKEKGTGLGLRTSIELMSKQCGRIEIESKKDSGTKVKLFFPIGK